MADKHQLAHIFADTAILLELKGDNPFKIRAYEAAARVLEELDMELVEFVASGRMAETKGIGKAIGQKIEEYIATGRIAYYEELKASVPSVLFELIRIPGLGPKKALTLHEKLGINSIGELEYACRENRLISLPGFGAKTQEKILQGIEFVKRYQGQFLLVDAWPIAESIVDYLRKQEGVMMADVAGSVRRRKETVKDIDIVLAGQHSAYIADLVTRMPGVQQVTSHGPSKVSLTLSNGMNLDARIVMPEEYASALHHFTGSKEHHVKLRGLAKDNNIKINEYGFDTPAGRVHVASEEELYSKLGLAYIEPELREDLGEVEAAAAKSLPVLVREEDIAGVLHVHTTYSDGSATLAEMAKAAGDLGYSYLGITDHSRTAVYAHGLQIDAVLEQRCQIEKLNASNPDFRILAGIESDILPDGSLDYPDDILAQFDFVIASVHSSFRQSRADMTQRIIKAMGNPYVSIVGHVTGRILLARDGYDVDLEAVIQAAKDTGTIMEINASPYRLDLDWRWCRRAKESGVLLSINPDAHATEELRYVRFGVTVARKGWLTPADVVNARPVEDALALLRRKRN